MLITIGRVLKPYGVKGEVKVEPITDFPERFGSLKRVVLESPRGNELPCTVRSVRYLNGLPYLCFEGYDSPEQAKKLNAWLIRIPQEEAVSLPEGQYYWFELVGMTVLSEAGEKLGEIAEVFATGSNDVYVMKQGKKEVYIPATKEVVKKIDRQARTMTIHVVEGLLD